MTHDAKNHSFKTAAPLTSGSPAVPSASQPETVHQHTASAASQLGAVSKTSTEVGASVDLQEVMQLLPHRYPMLLLDRLENIVLGESATGIKNVTANEWFFPGHFPSRPVMPGVLIVEALAQTAGALVMKTLRTQGHDLSETVVYFMSLENARFRQQVTPGDQLQLRVQKKHQRGMVWKFKGTAYVNDTLMAEAIYTAMIAKA